MAALLDIDETTEKYRYSLHNLGAVLCGLYARPPAPVIGPAVPPSLVEGILVVRNEYVKDVLKAQPGESDKWERNALVSVSLLDPR